MPRMARVIVPNLPHHIAQRGHNRKSIFVDQRDYQYHLVRILLKRVAHMERSWAVLMLILFALPTQAAVQMHYLDNDHLGTPRVVTNQARQVVWKGQLQPFGETRVEVEAITNHRRFPGQRFDIESRLYYNYFRDYDPTTGRYMQSDPIGLGDSLNTYTYASDNPINFIDPYGLFGQTVQGIPSGGHGAGTARQSWNQGPFGPICGPSSNLMIASWIPDVTPEACQEHDDCYGQCGSDRKQCDKDLSDQNTLYGRAVIKFGQSSYNDAQKQCRCGTP